MPSQKLGRGGGGLTSGTTMMTARSRPWTDVRSTIRMVSSAGMGASPENTIPKMSVKKYSHPGHLFIPPFKHIAETKSKRKVDLNC